MELNEELYYEAMVTTVHANEKVTEYEINL